MNASIFFRNPVLQKEGFNIESTPCSAWPLISFSIDPWDPEPKISDPGSEIRIQALRSEIVI